MIIFKGKTPVDCIQSDCVGVTGDNIAYTQEFYIKGISDESITYTIHLRFSDGSVNSVIPDVVVADGEGTAIRWIIKENDIFKHGYFEVQLEGRNKPGLVWQTEIVTLYADESLLVEDKAYENPNSETLKLRQEAYEMLKKLEEYDLDNKADKATTLSGYGITDAYTKEDTKDCFGFGYSVCFDANSIPIGFAEGRSIGAAAFSDLSSDLFSAVASVYISNRVQYLSSFSEFSELTDIYINSEEGRIAIPQGAIPETVAVHYVTDYEFGKNFVTALKNLNTQKADKATTLEGYGITDVYTKSYTDKLLNNKLDKMGFDTEPMLNSPNYLTSGTVYTALQKKADKSTASELQVEITSLQNSLSELSNMIYANEYAATLIIDDDGTTFSDNNGDVMLADWKLKEA